MKTFASYEDAKKEIDRFNSLISELYDVSTISSKIDYVYFFLINNKYVYAAAINKVPNIEVGAQNEFSYELYFVELTPDCSEIKIPYKGVEKFKGLKYKYFSSYKSIILEYIKIHPELNIILDKYKEWPGWSYNYAIVEMKRKDGGCEYGVGLFQYLPNKFLKELDKNIHYNRAPDNGAFGYDNKAFALREAFLTWKSEELSKRFEKHSRYYTVNASFKEKDDVYEFAMVLLEEARKGAFEDEKAEYYIHPVNRWTSEESVYKLACNLYGKKNVVYQYRPQYLKSSKNGQMSFDVFIKHLNVAIEYQGIQHFEPIDYFGGYEAFEKLIIRDAEKKEMCEKNKIHLIYILYNEEITQSLIEKRVNEVLNQRFIS